MAVTDISQPVQQITQTAAIVLGAAWGYAKFVRGRTFRPRGKLDVEATLDHLRSDPYLIVSVSMKNEGLGRIRLARDMSLIRVDALPSHEWTPGANARWHEDKPIMITAIFHKHEWIEPGELIADQVLLPLPREKPPAVAYQVRAWVRVPRRGRKTGIAWSANAVIPMTSSVLHHEDEPAIVRPMLPGQAWSPEDDAAEARRQLDEQRQREERQAKSSSAEADVARRQLDAQRLKDLEEQKD
jgi:hypothetical protein